MVTNYHVINRCLFDHEDASIRLVTHEGEVLRAQVLAVDVMHDLGCPAGAAFVG